MLNHLPHDILFEISSYLNIIDTLKFITSVDNYFIIYYTSYVIKIQKWYFKYKKRRDVRYLLLKEQFQIRNQKIYSAYYLNIFFSLYYLNKLKKNLKEYYFYSLLKYHYNDIENEDIDEDEKKNIFELYKYTMKNMNYSNLKIFLKKLPMKLLLRT
jgi:hypothetical protein